MTLQYQRLRVPATDGGTLQIPPLNKFSETLSNNRNALSSHRFEMAGQPIEEVRTTARRQLVELAIDYSRQYRDVIVPGDFAGLVLAGHQPTLFHPGVWYKNFALDAIARINNLAGVNLVIDNDLSAAPSIRVPAGDINDPKIEFVKFDSQASLGPFELETVHDVGLFESFGQRVVDAVGPFVPQPLIQQLWPLVVSTYEHFGNPAAAIAAGRHRLEENFDLQTLEVPLSRACETLSFSHFAAELVLRAGELRTLYNETLAEYRRVHHIRSSAHPVPALEHVEEWVELPFWIWSNDKPGRKRLFVKWTGDQVTFGNLLDQERTLDRENLAAQIFELSSNGISLRPRALLTTMYSRLVLSDGFLHGIGGSKYDQLTDQIIRRFFHVEPPTYNTVSGTFRLPVDMEMARKGDLVKARNRLRQMQFHPERFIGDRNGFTELVKQKKTHLTQLPASGSKKDWHDGMQSINERLVAGVEQHRQAAADEVEAIAERLRVSELLGSREFSFCLFDESLIGHLSLHPG